MDAAKLIPEVEAEIQRLQNEKDNYQQKIFEIEDKIETFKQILAGLRYLGNPKSKPPVPSRLDLEGLGLQDAVLKTLRHSRIPMTPLEIREALVKSGITVTSPKNLLISIHTALTRLEDKLEKSMGAGGKPAFTLNAERLPANIAAYLGKAEK